MLETEEVDVDYFTPASSTSLAKIFSNSSQIEEENNTLKYVPPLPAQVKPPTQKLEEKKPTQCLYATALYAYEWVKDSYVSKERVGFAIMNTIKSSLHSIVLYDSSKTTLSCLTITTNTIINVKENVSISYYDNQQKYWNVYPTPPDLNKILDLLKGLNVSLEPIVGTTKVEPEKDDIDSKNKQVLDASNTVKASEKESDTDSSVNRRTKDSILKRMATMGQSVLPTGHLNATRSSDSSDTNETHIQQKIRHKPFKPQNKRNVEKNIESDEPEQIKNIISKPTLPSKFHGMFPNEQQIVAVKTIDMVRSPVSGFSEGNDMALFMSEQRVSNSELRINVNRMTDKLDLVLDKVKSLENVDKNYQSNSGSQFQNEIIHKLLKEYEAKIKNYEDFIKSKGFQYDTLAPIDANVSINVVDKKTEANNEKQCNCKQLCEEKDKTISQLNKQLQSLFSQLEGVQILKNNEVSLTKEIDDLKVTISMQNDQITSLNKKMQNTLSNEGVSNKIKKVMNDVFQNISANFEDETSYTGANIRNLVAAIIKKTTKECLKELN